MEVHLQNKTKPMYYYCTYKNDVNSIKGWTTLERKWMFLEKWDVRASRNPNLKMLPQKVP